MSHRRKRIPMRAAAQPAISPTTVTIIHPEHASKIPKCEIFMKFQQALRALSKKC